MKNLSWAAFLLLVCTSGNPSRTPEQGFLWHPGGSAPCPNFALIQFLFMVCHCRGVSASMYSYALTPRPPCRPWAWMLTDAGWGCRAQLGLIAAVYLIKTWEDPTGVSAREDATSIYRFEHRYTHVYIRGDQARNQVLVFVSRAQVHSRNDSVWIHIGLWHIIYLISYLLNIEVWRSHSAKSL